MMRILSFALAVVALSIGAALLPSSSSWAASVFETRTGDAGGVRVVVTPKAIEAGAAVWEFEVTMDTHVKPLAEDLIATSVLVDGSGRRTTPVAWQGDPPGGHHRKGILRFAAPADAPKVFELQLTGVGGADLRTFRWEAK